MSYFRNNALTGTVLCFLIFLTSCKEKPPKLSNEDIRATERKMAEVNRIMLSKDKKRIEGYIDRQQLEMQESATGLWYSIQNPDSGDSVKQGMNVNLKYRLTVMEGEICYDSGQSGLKSFRVGRGGVESGLEEGILMMRIGGVAKFIMPPHLAYGLPGDGDCIPPRSIIIYDIEVLSAD